MVDVDAGGHAQVVDDLVSHQLHILPRLTHHHLLAQLVICVYVLITLLVLSRSSDHYHRLLLSPAVYFVID